MTSQHNATLWRHVTHIRRKRSQVVYRDCKQQACLLAVGWVHSDTRQTARTHALANGRTTRVAGHRTSGPQGTPQLPVSLLRTGAIRRRTYVARPVLENRLLTFRYSVSKGVELDRQIDRRSKNVGQSRLLNSKDRARFGRRKTMEWMDTCRVSSASLLSSSDRLLDQWMAFGRGKRGCRRLELKACCSGCAVVASVGSFKARAHVQLNFIVRQDKIRACKGCTNERK